MEFATECLRFLKFVEVVGDCWIWTGYRDRYGYGRFRLGADKIVASRAAFLISRGYLEEGKLVCHICDNRACVNPDHLYSGSARDNARDMWSRGRNKNSHLYAQKNKTACSRGHDLDETNTYHWRGHRSCKACRRLNSLKYSRRKANNGKNRSA